jgi:hypothetical protein
LHHFRLTIPGFDKGVEAMINDGIQNIASGTGVHVGSRWAYFDTTHNLDGVIIELRSRLEGHGGEGQWVQPAADGAAPTETEK